MSIIFNNIKSAFQVAFVVLVLSGASAEAGTFGVPVNVHTDGRLCTGNNAPAGGGCTAAATNPPGWLILAGDNATATGDTVHQTRMFIEVTGTTLDVKVFDAGSSGIRDIADSANDADTVYTLFNPAGGTVATVTLTTDSATTENRLARMQNGSFVAANAGTVFAVTPGLYELRIATEADAGTDNQTNAFGLDIRDGAGVAYNVFTIGQTPSQASAFLAGRWGSSSTAPIADVSGPMPLFPFVEQGCTVIASNFHADSAGPATLVDALGQSTSLTLSTTNSAQQTLTVETAAAINLDATNYGMWPLTHAVTTPAAGNIVDWRFADYRGWTTAPTATVPGDPRSPIRMYLPNSAAAVGGSASAVTPNEPVLRATYFVVSGSNLPQVGSVTRVRINAALDNPGPGQISNVILQIPMPATGAAFVAGSALATLNGVTTPCAEPGGVPGLLAGSTTAMQCTLTAPVPAGSVAALGVNVDLTPAASGLLNITGRPSLAVSGITRATTTATATTVQPHWFSVGDSVTIAGGSVPGYNITATILATPSATTFTYTVPGAGATSTGTITATENGGDRSAVALYTPAYSSVTTRSENAGPICQLTGTAVLPVNLGITKTAAPNPVTAGANITYTITANNPAGGNAAPTAAMIDVLPPGTTFQSLTVPTGWACTNPGVGNSGTVSCTRASFPANTTSVFTLVVQVALFTTDAAVISNTATVTSGGFETNPANNSASAATRVTAPRPVCATGVAGSPTSVTGIVNSYFPGTANAANGATSITIGARLGAAVDIVAGDLLLVIQMQDAAIDSTNTATYGGTINGTTALNNVGRYEYVMATNTVGAAGGTVTLATALTRGPYTNANASGTQGQRRFQLVRVPQYVTTTLTSGLTARAWDGAVGGVVAVDVVGTLALGGATVDVSGLGFRGGQGRGLTGGTGTDTDYRNPAAQGLHGSKGEGIAGTPRYLWSVAGGAVDTGIDGYPNGSSARGRPGNAGGGGTDDDAINAQNSGGGGGGNGGAGGRGGNAWSTQATLGGLGGAAFAVAADRLVLGGGGGAGSRNNSSAEMGSGGAGGGLVFIRAGSMTGTATINANGQAGVNTLQDGAGGGGAGGSILALAVSGGTSGLTINARGADGGDAWPTQAAGGTPGERHGPGGGGGGGAVFVSTGAPAPSVAFGANGTTTTSADAFGAQVGVVGSSSITGTLNATIPAACSVAGTADLSVTKSANPGVVLAGDDITYTVQVQNLGPTTALFPILAESVPTNTTFQSLSVPSGWSCAGVPTVGGTGSFTCSAASLASAASATFTFVVRVNLGTAAGTVVTNTASVSSITTDTNSPNNASLALKNVEAPLPLVTRATIAGLQVDPEGRVRFATGSQRGTGHFDLYASNDRFRASDLKQVNREPIQAPVADSRTPLLYDVLTDAIGTRYLYIAETEVRGTRNLMGPFLVGDPRLESAYDRIEKRLSEAGAEEMFARGAQSARILAPRERRAASKQFRETVERLRASREARRERRRSGRTESAGLKIEISQPGRVELTRAQLSDQGLPSDVPLRSVHVTSFGQPVATTVTSGGGALAFEADSRHTTYTGENVYVLNWQGKTPAPGVPLSVVDPVPPGVTRINKRTAYYVYTEGIDPWAWDALWGSTWPDASWNPEAGTFDLPGFTPSTLPVPFELKVAGGSDHHHIITAWLNGRPLGEVEVQGTGIGSLRGVVDGLQTTGNRLTISYGTSEGAYDAYALISHLDLTLPPATGLQAVVEDMSPFSTALPSFANVDTLVITHGDFADAAQRFAGLKQAEGHRVAVVDVERAYDAFSAGIVEAEAIHALIQQAAKQSRGLKYVVLVGDDTSDPEDFLGLGEASFIPSLYAGEWVASENFYADLDGDGKPEVAIGRFPVRTAEEAETMVDKVALQAQAVRAGAGRHVFAVDNGSGESNPFLGEANTVAAHLPSGSSLSLADIDDGIVAARNTLDAGFAAGAFVHYFGHGGREIWADENLLDVAAVDDLTGPGSVVLTWACQVQDYQYFLGHSVNEALLLKPAGGALATFGPSGVTDQSEQTLLYSAFYERMNEGGTLGEMIRDAKAAALEGDPRARAAIEGFNLLGDPSLLVAAPQAAAPAARPRPRVR